MKVLSTQNKIKFLQKFLKKQHRKWHENHPENIVGFRIGKKVKNGIESKFYSIIFHVKEKSNEEILDKSTIIPKYFKIKFPDGKKRTIKTDVEETGTFDFHTGITSEINSIYSTKFGSTGLFVKDSNDRVYAITNYHVVAEQMIEDQVFYYRRPISYKKKDVRIILNSTEQILGRFEEGIITHEVDTAFIELFVQPDNRMNILPDQNKVRGRITTRPYPPSFIGKPLYVYSYYNRMGTSGTINDNSSILYTNNPDIYFEDLVQIKPKITQGGDSGGLVVTPSFSVVGLIIGADPNYTYAIPFYKIDDFKNIFII